MTTYFCDFVNGADANNGLGPDASHASNKPWKTLTKALGAAGISSGDTVYLAPGTFREVVTVAMTSAAAETFVLGDPANAQGFKTSGGVRVTAGDVILSAYTTNDTTAPSASVLLNIAGRDYLTFQDLTFVGGSNTYVVDAITTTTSDHLTFRRCVWLPAGAINVRAVGYAGQVDTNAAVLFDSCIFAINSSDTITRFALPTSTVADYDAGITFQNCLWIGGTNASYGIYVAATGVNSSKPGGMIVKNCTFFGGMGRCLHVADANQSTTIPIQVRSCYLNHSGSSAALSATSSGQIVEDYNLILSGTPRTNVAIGTNSISNGSRANMIHVGQNLFTGAAPRAFFSPMAGSPLLGFGTDGTYSTATDAWGRARPAGGNATTNAVGYLERHDTGAQETTTIRTGSNALVILGPGDHDFQLPVDAVSTTVSVYARYDATHAATNKPQMQVTNGDECGVATATATMTAAADNWEQLSLTFTPARAGIVTIRLISRSAAANGHAFFDDFLVA